VQVESVDESWVEYYEDVIESMVRVYRGLGQLTMTAPVIRTPLAVDVPGSLHILELPRAAFDNAVSRDQLRGFWFSPGFYGRCIGRWADPREFGELVMTSATDCLLGIQQFRRTLPLLTW
jgi:hypothetical protein